MKRAHLIGPPLSAFVGVVSLGATSPPWKLSEQEIDRIQHWWPIQGVGHHLQKCQLQPAVAEKEVPILERNIYLNMRP